MAWTTEYGLLHRMGMPPRVLEAMFSYTRAIQRRFKLGTSIGPLFPNTNGIMQGCPLAILRINCIMMAWARTIQHNAHTSLCTIGVYMDDKNARASSLQQLQDVVKLTESFDDHIDAVVNLRKTVAYATATTSRRSLSSVTINNQPVPTLADDRLLGAQASFTKRRSRALADKRAADYLTVAERVVICPLNIAAKETILTTAGGTKYSFGLEMGGCSKKLETSLRSTVVQALWRGRARQAADIILTKGHKGHRFDPVQLRVIWPVLCARKQLLKHPSLRPQWLHLWHLTQTRRANLRDGRSNMTGPLAIIQTTCKDMGWTWTAPFTFLVPVGHGQTLEMHLLQQEDAYFLHILRLGASRMLWSRTSTNRKEFRGIQNGIDKKASLALLNSRSLQEYDRGILRSIVAGAIYTQRVLFISKKSDHPVCVHCWQQQEDLLHLFWHCPAWIHIRSAYLSAEQLRSAQTLPPCTLRAGLFGLWYCTKPPSSLFGPTSCSSSSTPLYFSRQGPAYDGGDYQSQESCGTT